MKIRKTAVMLAACMGMTLLAGCDSEQQKIFNEAVKDLEQGSYGMPWMNLLQSVNNGSVWRFPIVDWNLPDASGQVR